MRWDRNELLPVLERAGSHFQSDGHHLHIKCERTGITRFANNEITDNQFFSDAQVTIRAYTGARVGTATVNQLDVDSIRRGIERAQEIAQSSPADPEFTGPPAEQAYPDTDGYDQASANTPPEERARFVASVIKACMERNLNGAGYLQTTEEIVATHTSAGAPSYHRGTTVQFSMSAKTEDASGSGWVLRWANALSDLDIAALAQTAIDKAAASKNPVELPPGRYTVVLEPVACEFLLWNLTRHLDARAAEEGRSFLSQFDASGDPGGTRVGERLFSPHFSLKRQVSAPLLQTHPFDEDGIALDDVTLVREGVLENLSYDRYWASQKGVRPTGALKGMRMEGSGRSTRDLIREAGDGILVTRLWYIRGVDRMKSAVTGMTRDGTFRIEGGEIAEPIKNFRFNEELRRLFRDFTASGSPERFWDFLSPGIIVPDFHFTSTTESI
jgi:predicted Zn-dependent protease